MSLQDSFFNDNRDNRDNFCDDSICFNAKPVVSIVSIVVLFICPPCKYRTKSKNMLQNKNQL